MIVERDEYKGNKMIVLKRDEMDKYPFKFGLGKAKMVVEAIKDIEGFIEECELGVANDKNAPPDAKDDIPF